MTSMVRWLDRIVTILILGALAVAAFAGPTLLGWGILRGIIVVGIVMGIIDRRLHR